MKTKTAAPNKAANSLNCNINTGTKYSSNFTISEPLKKFNQWLLWKLVDGKKIPLNTNFYPTDPTKGYSYQEVSEAYDPSRCSGLGFIAGNGVVAVDLDHCITNGKLNTFAEKLVEELATYTEISQSGTGLHLFFLDNTAPEVGRKNSQLEIYTANHYIAMTGNRWANTPADLAILNGKTVELLRRYFVKRKPINEQADSSFKTGWKCSNEDVLKRAKLVGDKKFQRLFYDGDISGYASQSEADTALMCKLYMYTGGCEEQMRELFSQSALGKRDKWLNREDYQDKVVNAAVNFMESLTDSSISQQFLQKTLQQEKLEITNVYTEEFLHHLAVCKLDESIASQALVLQFKNQCKKFQIPLIGTNGLNKQIDTAVAKLLKLKNQLDINQTINELHNLMQENKISLPDNCTAVIPPNGFCFDWNTHKTIKTTQAGKSVMFNSINLITQQSVNVESGKQKLTVATLKSGEYHWNFISADREIFASTNKIISLATAGLDVNSKTAGDMVKFLDDLENTNKSHIPTIKTVLQTGWFQNSFVIPSISSGYQLDDTIKSQVIDVFTTSGTKAAIIPLLQKILHKPLIQVVIGATLAAPLVKFLGCDNIAIHIFGLAGSGKSTLNSIAFSLFGNPNVKAAIPTADSTKVGLEYYFASRRDLPAFIEDLSSVSDIKTKELMKKLPYQFGNSTGRLRGTPKGNNQKLLEFRGSLITNDEKPVTTNTSEGGGKRRVIELQTPDVLFDVDTAQVIHDTIADNYGLFRNDWIQYIQQHSEELVHTYREHKNSLMKQYPDKVPRHLMSLAACMTALQYFSAGCLQINEEGGG